jgi:hypothetical protein
VTPRHDSVVAELDRAIDAPIVRLVILPRGGDVLVHDLTRDEAIEFYEALGAALDAFDETLEMPPVMPTWDGGPSSFSPEILAEFDARHPLRELPQNAVVMAEEREIERIARVLGQKGIDPDLALDLLLGLNVLRGMPPLQQPEVERIVGRALEREANYMVRAYATP